LAAIVASILATARSTAEPESARSLVHLTVNIPVALAANETPEKVRRWNPEQLVVWSRECDNGPVPMRTEEMVWDECQQAQALLNEMREKLGSRKAMDAWMAQKPSEAQVPAEQHEAALQPA
jgi:hypothetical protein